MGFSNRIAKWLRKLNPPPTIVSIEEALANRKIVSCMNNVTIEKSGRFYEQAKVYNLQKDKSKITIGANTHIRAELHLFAYGGEITVGNNCYLGDGTRIWSGEKISIGNNVLVSHNCNIMDTNSHEIDALERAEGYANLIRAGHPASKGSIVTAPVIIEDYAWISFNCIILKGVRIGKGAIIAAGSVVTKDIPPFVVAAGNPAVVVKNLNPVV